ISTLTRATRLSISSSVYLSHGFIIPSYEAVRRGERGFPPSPVRLFVSGVQGDDSVRYQSSVQEVGLRHDFDDVIFLIRVLEVVALHGNGADVSQTVCRGVVGAEGVSAPREGISLIVLHQRLPTHLTSHFDEVNTTISKATVQGAILIINEAARQQLGALRLLEVLVSLVYERVANQLVEEPRASHCNNTGYGLRRDQGILQQSQHFARGLVGIGVSIAQIKEHFFPLYAVSVVEIDVY